MHYLNNVTLKVNFKADFFSFSTSLCDDDILSETYRHLVSDSRPNDSYYERFFFK